MSQLQQSATNANGRKECRENWTAGGFVATLLIVPTLVALMAAPGVVLGAALGVVGLKLAERASRQLNRNANVDGRSTPTDGFKQVA